MSESIVIETETLNNNNPKLKRRSSVREIVNEKVEKSWRSVTTGLGKILETRAMNTVVILILAFDISLVVAQLLVKLYKREYNSKEYPNIYEDLDKVDHIFYWILFGLRTFYLVMVVVRVCSYGFIYLADPLNLFDAFIVTLAAIFFYIFNEKDKIMSSFFILCRFWRINRVLEFTEQKKKIKHEENYQRLQRRLTVRLEGERTINDELRKELEDKDKSLNILMGGDLVTNKDKKKTAKRAVKFDEEDKKSDSFFDFDYIRELNSHFNL